MPDSNGATVCDDLPEPIIVWEILARLPPEDVLRCRAVRQSWRRATSTREFVLAHHRNQPSLPIVHIPKGPLNLAGDGVDMEDSLLVPDLRASELRPFLSYATRRLPDNFFTLHAACDGLLLISLSDIHAWDRRYYICNPATRRRAFLPRLVFALDEKAYIAGLYPHGLSGEYRVLYWTRSAEADTDPATYHVLSLRSDGDQPRCIGRPAACASVKKRLEDGGLPHATNYAPVLLRGSLHWAPRHHGEDMMVFDVVAETFRSMRPAPSAGKVFLLFEMEGTLAAICGGASTITLDLWLLQDYEAELWTVKHPVGLTALLWLSDLDDVAWDNTISLSGEHDLLVHCPWYISYCDIKGKRLQNIDFQRTHGYHMEFTPFTPHRLKLSLAPLAFLGMHENDDDRHPPSKMYCKIYASIVLCDPFFRL